MPELPEVTTTAKILDSLVSGKKILSVWTDYNSPYYKGKDNIKDPKYFSYFKKEVSGKKIISVYRRAKNVLINLEGDKTILIHMKMTGHLLYGKYQESKDKKSGFGWVPKERGPLQNPFSRFIHLVFTLSDGKQIAFSDMRKFATVQLISDKEALIEKFKQTGPEPLDPNFDWKKLKERLLIRPNYKIKTALMDSTIIAGIGNIYSDEILWSSSIHPERLVKKITDQEFKEIYKWTKKLLTRGIDFGGDSMSDYRNPYGEKGDFQNHHNAYQKKGDECNKKGCSGSIIKKKIGGRTAHFCDTHQI